MPDGSIIYVRGWEIDGFFQGIYPSLKNKIVLITGESDLSVPASHHRHYVQSDSKILHWFGQNSELVSSQTDHRFTAIPIGLNCKEQSAHMTKVQLEYQGKKMVQDEALEVDDPLRIFSQEAFGKLLLLNYDPTTDSTGERQTIWNNACTEGNADNWLEFADCFGKERGVVQYDAQMQDIYKRNLRYKFWLSPRGNGLDCHRTWEALYFGRIPIVRSSTLDGLLNGLPVLIISDWNQITRAFLEESFTKILENRRAGKYSFDKLQRGYWSNIILEKSRHEYPIENRTERCWNMYL